MIMDIVVASEVEGQSQMAAAIALKAKHCCGIWLRVPTANFEEDKSYSKKFYTALFVEKNCESSETG